MGLAAHGGLCLDVDTAVLERARRGETEAFADLIRDHEPRLRALAYRLLGDRDVTDDVMQEAYVKAFRALPRFRGDSSVSTWLYRITYNVPRRAAPVTDGRAAGNQSRRGTGAPGLADRLGRLGDTTQRPGCRAGHPLPPEHRAAVLLVDADGLDYAEAGKVLSIPAGTVGSRLNRARATLRLVLGESA